MILNSISIAAQLYVMHTCQDALTGDDEADKLVAAPLVSSSQFRTVGEGAAMIFTPFQLFTEF